MKKFLKNLTFGVDIKLQVPPLTYKIIARNISGGTYSLTSTPYVRFLRNFFMAIFLFEHFYIHTYISTELNIYTKHKISMIRVRTPKYSPKSCVFSLLAALSHTYLVTTSPKSR